MTGCMPALVLLAVFALCFVCVAIPRRKGTCGNCGKELWSIYPHATLDHKTRSGLYSWFCEDGKNPYRQEDREIV